MNRSISRIAISAICVGVLPVYALAQQPPLTGTVNPRAVAPPVMQPPPIGGLRTAPLGAPAPAANPLRKRHHTGIIPLRVDAPLLRGGALVVYDGAVHDGMRWFPSASKPVWRVDSLAPKVDAWRDLLVDDVICTDNGVCLERTTRVRARWSAFCNCYRFADALNRIWVVE